MKRIGIGFDGMCSDVSVVDLAPHFKDIKQMWPVLDPLVERLEAGRDEELTCQATGLTQDRFYEILGGLQRLRGARVETHIGANASLETLTAISLLEDRVPPVVEAQIDYLGFWSPRTLERVPERIPESVLGRAGRIEDSEAVSLIIPHGGKRAILSFGGNPPVRALSPELRAYLERDVLRYFKEVKPDLLILVGTAVTWSAGEKDDFDLLRRVIQAARLQGTAVLFDLGGLGSWRDEALKWYFSVLGDVTILSMNESELAAFYTQRTGRADLGTRAKDVAAMVRAVLRPGQGGLVHTPAFQLAYGLKGPVREALEFAGKAASCRAQLGRFPTAREVAAAQLRVAEKGKREIAGLPPEFVAVAGYDVEVKNPVGLGDTWTCSFALSYLSTPATGAKP